MNQEHQPVIGTTVLGSKPRFKRLHTALFALVFGVIGLVVLLTTLAFNADLGDFEAETMSVTSNTAPAPTPTDYSTQFWNQSAFTAPPTIPATTPNLSRTDQSIDNNWQEAAPASTVGKDYFVVRSTATKTFKAANYKFSVTADDGVRVYVDDSLIIDQWKPQAATTYNIEKTMTAGTHTIRVEYYEQTGRAVLQFSYKEAGPAVRNYTTEFWNRPAFSTPPTVPATAANLTKTDTAIDYNWQTAAPGGAIYGDYFVVRSVADKEFKNATYQFKVTSDDGVRVYIDNVLLIDQWKPQGPTTYTASKQMTAGVHNIKIEYYEQTGRAVLQFGYTQTSAETPTQAVSTSSETVSQVIDDTNASAGKALRLNVNSTATKTTTTKATTSMTVFAKADVCEGAPTMIVKVDGTTVATHNVTTSSYSPYKTALNLTAGSHKVDIEYANDAALGSCNRNLILDKVEFEAAASDKVVALNDGGTGTGDYQFDFSGNWSSYNADNIAYKNDVHWSEAAGAYYQVKFNGTQVKLYSVTDPRHGLAGVSIDGGPETQVDFYSPTRTPGSLVWTSPKLASGNHTIKIRVTGQKRPEATGTTIVADRMDVVGAPEGAGPAAPTEPVPNPPTNPPTNPNPIPTGPNQPVSIFEWAKGNPWTTPIPNSVPLLDAGTQNARKNEFLYALTVPFNGTAVGIEQYNWSSTIYLAYRNGEVRSTEGQLLGTGPFRRPNCGIGGIADGIDGKGWPMPAGNGMGGTVYHREAGEGHVTIWAPETGRYVDIYNANVSGGAFTCSYGGSIANTRNAKVYGYYSGSPGTQWVGGVAGAQPIIGMTITERDIRHAVARYKAGDYANAYIPHILGYEFYRHTLNTWEYPASKTDFMGNGADQVKSYGVGGKHNYGGHGDGVIPMGGIWRLNPAVNVFNENFGLSNPEEIMMARIFARTLQIYGATMTDWTGGAFVFLAEQAEHKGEGRFNYLQPDRRNKWTPWIRSMLMTSTNNNWVQFINTGRHLEVDTGQPAPAGAYRPPVN